MDSLLGDKVPSQCEEALEDCECDVMSTQQCCIIYNVMHGHQPYSFWGRVEHGTGFVDTRILIVTFWDSHPLQVPLILDHIFVYSKYLFMV